MLLELASDDRKDNNLINQAGQTLQSIATDVQTTIDKVSIMGAQATSEMQYNNVMRDSLARGIAKGVGPAVRRAAVPTPN